MIDFIRNKAAWFLVCIIAFSAILAITSLHEGHNWGDDFGMYILQAKAIATKDLQDLKIKSDYCFSNADDIFLGPRLYPWGFPLLLSGIYALFGLNPLAMKMLVVIFYLLSLGVMFYLFENKIGKEIVLLIVALFAFNPTMLAFSDNILSDIPCLFFFLLAILLVQAVVEEGKRFAPRTIEMIILGLIFFYSYWLRPTGIVLIPTLFICQWTRFQSEIRKDAFGFLKRNWIQGIPYASFLIFWKTANHFLPEGSLTNLELLKMIGWKHLWENAAYYARLPMEFYGGNIYPVIYGVTILLAFWGGVKNFKRDNLYISFFIIMLGVFILWPPTNGLRYIFPLIPFYIYFTFIGLYEVLKIIPKNVFSKGIPAFCAISLLSYFTYNSVRYAYFNQRAKGEIIEGPFTRESQEMFNFIRNVTKKEDVVIFRKPRILMLLTDRRATVKSNIEDILQIQKAYLVLDDHVQLKLKNQLDPKIFKTLFNNGRFTIYYFQNNKATSAGL